MLEIMFNMVDGFVCFGVFVENLVVCIFVVVFEQVGFDLVVVGGLVWDVLFGCDMYDFDFIMNVLFDDILCIVILVLMVQWDIGCVFGMIGVCVQWEQVEIIMYCVDSYDGVICKLIVEFGDMIDGDFVCCDFMVNFMVLQVFVVKFVDLIGGVEDFIVGVLCIFVDFWVLFGDDLLWMLWVVCFSVQFGFCVEEVMVEVIVEFCEILKIVSFECIQFEFVCFMQMDDFVCGICVLVDIGLIDEFLFEIIELCFEVDEYYYYKDVYEYFFIVFSQVIEFEYFWYFGVVFDVLLCIVVLLYDIGKFCIWKLEVGGVVMFYYYDVVGVCMVCKCLQVLCFDIEMMNVVVMFIELYLCFFGYVEGVWMDVVVCCYVCDVGDFFEWLYIFICVDVMMWNKCKVG